MVNPYLLLDEFEEDENKAEPYSGSDLSDEQKETDPSSSDSTSEEEEKTAL